MIDITKFPTIRTLLIFSLSLPFFIFESHPHCPIMSPVPISQINTGHIDDVQELRKAKPTLVPERFVRDATERPTLQSANRFPTACAVLDHDSYEVPIIDFSKLMKVDEDEGSWRAEILKLKRACQDWGFFQVVNHGIDLSLVEGIEEVAKEFFMLPLEEKQRYPMVAGTVQGYGQAFVFSEDQKLDWCNMFALGVEPQFIRNPKLWPKNPPKFSGTVDDYSREVRKLCQNLLNSIAITLGLKEGTFNEMFGVGVQAIRMNYYPPCALVINIGDTLEVLTNGKYKSVEHRALTHKEKDRLSIVTFYAPSYEVEIGPLPEMVDEINHPCTYRRYNHGEYSKHYVTSKLQGKKTLDFAKIIN
ncbi:unnamed protein product [Linum tenue]|uniref:Uncharacterized protein n=1 Tax=Linum tenue TaxID=586396 RepID=A0AAV0P6N2_9ROSI|nr:unnamed protein product [Linum tenue]